MKDVKEVGTVVMVGVFAAVTRLAVAQSTATGPAVKPAAVATSSSAVAVPPFLQVNVPTV